VIGRRQLADHMDEILYLLIRLVLELLANLLCFLPADWPFSRRSDRTTHPFLAALLFALLGAVIGLVLTIYHPGLFIPSGWLQIAGLIIIPLANGSLSALIAFWRSSCGAQVSPGRHFAYAACFSMGFMLVRYVAGNG
jgi:hypothetical protein